MDRWYRCNIARNTTWRFFSFLALVSGTCRFFHSSLKLSGVPKDRSAPVPTLAPDDAAEVAPVEEAEDLQLDLHRERHEARPRLHRFFNSLSWDRILSENHFLLHTFHKYRRMKRYKKYTWRYIFCFVNLTLYKTMDYCNNKASKFFFNIESLTSLNTILILFVSTATVKWWYKALSEYLQL